MMPPLRDAMLRILTWHIHGNYLFYLTHTPHQFYLPVKPGAPPGYAGKASGFPWPSNVHEIPADRVRDTEFDCVLFQSRTNYLEDQYEILSETQRRLPRLYLEHDPPREHPTDTRHPVDDPQMLLVHVTAFNELMWDNGSTPTRVIEHGVAMPDEVRYSGEIARGVVIINMLHRRGRRLGADLFERIRREVPLDLIGMGSEELGGLGEIPHDELPAFVCRYRFLFNPIRYTSLGLAVCEAMTLGVPVVGLATTEMAMTVENGVSGYVHTDWRQLLPKMHELLRNRDLAAGLGEGARRVARARFSVARFAAEWDQTFRQMVAQHIHGAGATAVQAGA